MRAFLATAEEGSFSGAARVLKTTQPTIGRQIGALEEALGVTLVERSVRGLTLTEAGRDLIDHTRTMGEAATLISMVADGKSQEVSGEVTVTGTDLLSAAILPGVLKPLRQTASGIRVRIHASSEMQNLTQREADIAIRHVRPDQPDLIARHLGDFRANLYAATDYLDRAGRPHTPRDVATLDFVGNADPERLMAPLHNMGVPVRAESFVMSSESGVVAWELVKAGYGVSMQPETLGEAEPGLEKVLSDFPSLEFPIWLVTHRELQTSRRIRIVFDLLARGLTDVAKRRGSGD
ncbi:HTH-type transcriptional regulator, LysR family [Roseobacter litoralis Och 149]|uniref:HTH-type transcriptional regulator, LysR family n=1 Tax=Roseobacter litoralis (strain ATCC 49566 / DSM 6996 / JCM 21268 / NBRC 15278 / OCh 149) TaxID=391595 RepID=F7ZEH7_ROSLO|nr:HTH-type transcriptional regulator, LysR family [Roseobacter litoralis Och 149]